MRREHEFRGEPDSSGPGHQISLGAARGMAHIHSQGGREGERGREAGRYLFQIRYLLF